MSYKAGLGKLLLMVHNRIIVPMVGLMLLVFLLPCADAQFFDLPPLPPPEEYGNVLLNQNSEDNGVKPAVFSHWLHRTKYTCRVCHLELEFSFESNSTYITEEANREGRFCGACHNGKIAFGHTSDNCERCHNGDLSYSEKKFEQLAQFPRAPFGNRINWAKAMEEGVIRPRASIYDGYDSMPFDKRLVLVVEWGNIPPAIFAHKTHTPWLDCANCHPDIFNIKKKTTKHFSMKKLINSEYCGVCHLKVAFPLDDCKRCHQR